MKKEAYKESRTRRTGPKRLFRSDITLAPSVAEAAVKHAKELNMSQTEYFENAVSAYFKETLLNPPEPVKTKCEHCGAAIRPARSGWKRLRTSIRFDQAVRDQLESMADEFFAGNWSRAFEAAVRLYLGEDRNPPPEGKGKIMGVKLTTGRKTEENPAIKKPAGRHVESIESMIKKLGGKV